MLVRRAVVPARQRLALTGRPLAGMRSALARLAVEHQCLRHLLEEGERERDVALDHRPGAELVPHRKMDPYLAEERPRRSREVPAVVGEPADRRLAAVENLLLIGAGGGIVRILDHPGRQLPVDRATEAIHRLPCPSVWFPFLPLDHPWIPRGTREYRNKL